MAMHLISCNARNKKSHFKQIEKIFMIKTERFSIQKVANSGCKSLALLCCFLNKESKIKNRGLVRELNPGPLTPEARIIPLDQRADSLQNKGSWYCFRLRWTQFIHRIIKNQYYASFENSKAYKTLNKIKVSVVWYGGLRSVLMLTDAAN